MFKCNYSVEFVTHMKNSLESIDHRPLLRLWNKNKYYTLPVVRFTLKRSKISNGNLRRAQLNTTVFRKKKPNLPYILSFRLNIPISKRGISNYYRLINRLLFTYTESKTTYRTDLVLHKPYFPVLKFSH